MGQPKQAPTTETFLESCQRTLEEACISYEEADVVTRAIRAESAEIKRQKATAWNTIHTMKRQIEEIRSRGTMFSP